MKLTKQDIQDVLQRERDWCTRPRTLQEEQEDVAFLRSIEHTRLHVPAPPAAITTLIEAVEQELDESRRSATSRTRRVPGSFTPKPTAIREDGVGVGTGSQDQMLALPDDQARAWTQEGGSGPYVHREHGALHLHAGGRFTHIKAGKIVKSGSTQEALNAHLASLRRTTDTGPAGTASESAHDTLHRALTGGVIQEARPEGIHTKLAQAFGHSGAVLQEDGDGTPSDDVHTKLANALRSH